MKDDWPIAIAFLFVVLFLGLMLFATHESSKEFQRVCGEVGGKAVWDGRQHICIKLTQEK